eukprot:TRINITY_DN14998_c0_g1_i1.p1 TRINITY_DN14998_c0_g1~~TRINITY_DN14998_c0_g1_i1.p1  ORF type:complete len:511 (+),score=116.07 TRINITY_DN14998_c0_g1_i1:56-1588(+)
MARAARSAPSANGAESAASSGAGARSGAAAAAKANGAARSGESARSSSGGSLMGALMRYAVFALFLAIALAAGLTQLEDEALLSGLATVLQRPALGKESETVAKLRRQLAGAQEDAGKWQTERETLQTEKKKAVAGQKKLEEQVKALESQVKAEASRSAEGKKSDAERTKLAEKCEAERSKLQDEKKAWDAERAGLQREFETRRKRDEKEWQTERQRLLEESKVERDEKSKLLDAQRKSQKELAELQERCAAASSGSAEVSGSAATASWPSCALRDVAPRRRGGLSANLEVLLGDAATGCGPRGCRATDRVRMDSGEDCARLCTALKSCGSWSFSSAEEGGLCHLSPDASSDGLRGGAAKGLVSGLRGCSPPASDLPAPAALALAVADSKALAACDEGIVGAGCPDLHDAMRTWAYGIERLAEAVEGTSFTHDMRSYVEHVDGDARAFLDLSPKDADYADVFRMAVANNRQVFQSVRGILAAKTKQRSNRLDVSLPRPARGLLCQGSCVA